MVNFALNLGKRPSERLPIHLERDTVVVRDLVAVPQPRPSFVQLCSREGRSRAQMLERMFVYRPGMESTITPRQQRFAEEYLVDFNKTQAAIRAG